MRQYAPQLMLWFPKLLIGYIVISCCVFLFRLGGSYYSIISGFLYLLTFYAGFLAAYHAARAFGLKHPQGKGFFVITAGFVFSAIAQTIWYVMLNFGGVDPTSISGPFYILGYIFLISGLGMIIKAVDLSWKNVNVSLFVPTVMGGFTLAIFILIIKLFPMFTKVTTITTEVFDLIYLVGDLVLIVFCVLLLQLYLEYRKGMLGKPWLMITIAQFLILIADIFYAMFHAEYVNDIWPFSLINLVWLTANVSIAGGLWGIRGTLYKAQVILTENKKI